MRQRPRFEGRDRLRLPPSIADCVEAQWTALETIGSST
jgi:hypothetical protein